jgi:hypothetical protein
MSHIAERLLLLTGHCNSIAHILAHSPPAAALPSPLPSLSLSTSPSALEALKPHVALITSSYAAAAPSVTGLLALAADLRQLNDDLRLSIRIGNPHPVFAHYLIAYVAAQVRADYFVRRFLAQPPIRTIMQLHSLLERAQLCDDSLLEWPVDGLRGLVHDALPLVLVPPGRGTREVPLYCRWDALGMLRRKFKDVVPPTDLQAVYWMMNPLVGLKEEWLVEAPGKELGKKDTKKAREALAHRLAQVRAAMHAVKLQSSLQSVDAPGARRLVNEATALLLVQYDEVLYRDTLVVLQTLDEAPLLRNEWSKWFTAADLQWEPRFKLSFSDPGFNVQLQQYLLDVKKYLSESQPNANLVKEKEQEKENELRLGYLRLLSRCASIQAMNSNLTVFLQEITPLLDHLGSMLYPGTCAVPLDPLPLYALRSLYAPYSAVMPSSVFHPPPAAVNWTSSPLYASLPDAVRAYMAEHDPLGEHAVLHGLVHLEVGPHAKKTVVPQVALYTTACDSVLKKRTKQVVDPRGIVRQQLARRAAARDAVLAMLLALHPTRILHGTMLQATVAQLVSLRTAVHAVALEDTKDYGAGLANASSATDIPVGIGVEGVWREGGALGLISIKDAVRRMVTAADLVRAVEANLPLRLMDAVVDEELRQMYYGGWAKGFVKFLRTHKAVYAPFRDGFYVGSRCILAASMFRFPSPSSGAISSSGNSSNNNDSSSSSSSSSSSNGSGPSGVNKQPMVTLNAEEELAIEVLEAVGPYGATCVHDVLWNEIASIWTAIGEQKKKNVRFLYDSLCMIGSLLLALRLSGATPRTVAPSTMAIDAMCELVGDLFSLVTKKDPEWPWCDLESGVLGEPVPSIVEASRHVLSFVPPERARDVYTALCGAVEGYYEKEPNRDMSTGVALAVEVVAGVVGSEALAAVRIEARRVLREKGVERKAKVDRDRKKIRNALPEDDKDEDVAPLPMEEQSPAPKA